MTRILAVISCIFLVACTYYQTVPVSGKIEKTNERFVGTATASSTGQGNLSITTDEGVTCQGNYNAPIYYSPMEGVSSRGSFTCSDGRTGNFAFSGSNHQGSGFGTLSDGHKLIFTYGSVVNMKMQEF